MIIIYEFYVQLVVSGMLVLIHLISELFIDLIFLRAGRTPDAKPEHYAYKLIISIESFIALYQRIYKLETQTINPTYKKQQFNDLIESAQFLTSANECFSIKFEKLLGNPYGPQQTLEKCMHCPSCKNIKLY